MDGWLTLTDIPRRGKGMLSEPGQVAYDKGLVVGLAQADDYRREMANDQVL